MEEVRFAREVVKTLVANNKKQSYMDLSSKHLHDLDIGPICQGLLQNTTLTSLNIRRE